MRTALTLPSEPADRFWRISTRDEFTAVVWGRVGTIGRVAVTRHENAEACVAAAVEAVEVKIERGYAEPSADEAERAFDHHWYLDDGEWGPHPLTSHPRFVDHFAAPFFLSGTHGAAPFGSGVGSDAFQALASEVRRRGTDMDFAAFPVRLLASWGASYIAPEPMMDEAVLASIAHRDGSTSPRDDVVMRSDRVVVGCALGQAKITGRIDPTLQADALISLDRIASLWRLGTEATPRGDSREGATAAGLVEMRAALESFPCDHPLPV